MNSDLKFVSLQFHEKFSNHFVLDATKISKKNCEIAEDELSLRFQKRFWLHFLVGTCYVYERVCYGLSTTTYLSS